MDTQLDCLLWMAPLSMFRPRIKILQKLMLHSYFLCLRTKLAFGKVFISRNVDFVLVNPCWLSSLVALAIILNPRIKLLQILLVYSNSFPLRTKLAPGKFFWSRNVDFVLINPGLLSSLNFPQSHLAVHFLSALFTTRVSLNSVVIHERVNHNSSLSGTRFK